LRTPPPIYLALARRPLYILACLLIIAALPMAAFAGRSVGSRDLASRLRTGPGVANHPVGVVPSSGMTIPGDWPLAADGSITCKTCHAALPSLDGRDGPRLRGATESDRDSRAFCMNCHHEQASRTGAGMHWLAMSRAHVMHDSDDGGSSAGGSIDRGSAACLECHDGVTAPDAAYETSWNRGSGYLGDMGRNHPIGVRYPHAGARHRDAPLRPAAMLPETVRLPGGMVSCLSCHNLYATDPKHLTVPIEGSRLCMTCHQMD
jgi:predicted CXXCH cytochrome family protein